MGLQLSPLGQSLAPQPAASVPKPVPRPQGLAGTPQKESFLQGFLSDPSNRTFLMQVAASLLTNQGVFKSLSQGLEAKGRFATTDEQFKRRAQEDALKAKAARGSGGGGGANKNLQKSFEDWRKYFTDLDKDVGQWTVDEILGMAWMQALRDNGDSAAIELYNSSDDAGRRDLARVFAGGPERGRAAVTAYLEEQNKGGGDTSPPPNGGVPTDPNAEPEPTVATPALPTTPYNPNAGRNPMPRTNPWPVPPVPGGR